jgi:hypothetical protein
LHSHTRVYIICTILILLCLPLPATSYVPLCQLAPKPVLLSCSLIL